MSDTLLGLLAAVQGSGSISQAGRELGLSYRHAWGLVKGAEALFGAPLIDSGRGRGSTLGRSRDLRAEGPTKPRPPNRPRQPLGRCRLTLTIRKIRI